MKHFPCPKHQTSDSILGCCHVTHVHATHTYTQHTYAHAHTRYTYTYDTHDTHPTRKGRLEQPIAQGWGYLESISVALEYLPYEPQQTPPPTSALLSLYTFSIQDTDQCVSGLGYVY